jgi:hypothetical protein
LNGLVGELREAVAWVAAEKARLEAQRKVEARLEVSGP